MDEYVVLLVLQPVGLKLSNRRLLALMAVAFKWYTRRNHARSCSRTPYLYSSILVHTGPTYMETTNNVTKLKIKKKSHYS